MCFPIILFIGRGLRATRIGRQLSNGSRAQHGCRLNSTPKVMAGPQLLVGFRTSAIATGFACGNVPIDVDVVIGYLARVARGAPKLCFLGSGFCAFFHCLGRFLFLQTCFPGTRRPKEVKGVSIRGNEAICVSGVPLFWSRLLKEGSIACLLVR